WRMPVRCTIHSSDVSTMLSSSALVSTRFGSAVPKPRTTERIILYLVGHARGAFDRPARVILLQIPFDLVPEAVADHVVADIHRRGEALGIRAAMALDDDAVEAEEHAAVRLARVHLLAHAVEGALGENVAELGEPGTRHSRAQVFGDLPRRAFRRLQGDVS